MYNTNIIVACFVNFPVYLGDHSIIPLYRNPTSAKARF